MDKNTPVTDTQFASLCRRAVDSGTRRLADLGGMLTHEQADFLGDEGLGWISRRLGLDVRETSDGVELTPSGR